MMIVIILPVTGGYCLYSIVYFTDFHLHLLHFILVLYLFVVCSVVYFGCDCHFIVCAYIVRVQVFHFVTVLTVMASTDHVCDV